MVRRYSYIDDVHCTIGEAYYRRTLPTRNVGFLCGGDRVIDEQVK